MYLSMKKVTESSQKNALLVIIVVGVVALLGDWAIRSSREAQQAEQSARQAAEVVQRVTSAPREHELTYSQAINLYGSEGSRNRLQFSGTGCMASPGTMTVKQGTRVLFDNRGFQARTYKVGSQTVRIEANDFAVITMYELGNLNVTCDGGGTAKINVQQ